MTPLLLGLENTAVREPDIEDSRIPRIDRDIRNAAAHHRGSNRARFQVLEKNISQLHRPTFSGHCDIGAGDGEVCATVGETDAAGEAGGDPKG